MMRLRIAAPAEAELAAILATSLSRWGEEGRRRYKALLEATIQAILMSPSGPLTKDRSDVRSGYRSLHTKHARAGAGVRRPVHEIYFRTTANVVIVLGVLHERMDPGEHLSPRRSRRRR